MRSVTLVLPYPISANRYWRTYLHPALKRPVTAVSPEAKAYKREVALRALDEGLHEPIAGRIALRLQLYPHRPQDWLRRVKRDPLTWDDTVQCLDLDNAQKVAIDALKGVAFIDDCWIRRIEAERCEPIGEGRLVVTVSTLARASSPQQTLLAEAAA